MRWNNFFGGVLFAAAAAMAYFPWAIVAGPFIGSGLALSTFLAGTVTLYLIGACSTWRQGARIGLLAGAVAIGVVFVSPTLMVTLLALAVILAVARSALAYRAKVGRALLVEIVLGGIGVTLASFLFRDSMVSLALAIWGFYLVQSLFFLVGGKSERARETAGSGDAFASAHARAVAILEER